uniref:Uncharacterized protein n=1 Tax=Rhizophora mucronata TaxID=61149 RepID=A0A2P2QYB9_RHIMU
MSFTGDAWEDKNWHIIDNKTSKWGLHLPGDLNTNQY